MERRSLDRRQESGTILGRRQPSRRAPPWRIAGWHAGTRRCSMC